MKIYRLKVTYETVVRGSSVHAVECAANRIIRDSDDEPESEAVEITELSELPIGWDGDCCPWGVTDPHDRTLREILGQNAQAEGDGCLARSVPARSAETALIVTSNRLPSALC